MKKNYVAFGLILLLAGIAVWVLKQNGSSTVPKEMRDFAVADTASITRIFLADKANHQVTLTKLKAGEWRVNGKWKARNDGIRNLLFVIKNVSVKSMVGVNAVENVIKSLASGATKIEIYKDDKLIKVYYVGGATQDDEGTYMLLSDPDTKLNSSRPFVMAVEGQHRYLTPVYVTNESEWRDRTAFSFNPPDIRSVKLDFIQAKGKSFEITQPAANTFKLRSLKDNVEQSHFDTLAVKQYLTYCQAQGFESFLDDMKKAKRDSLLSSSPLYVLSIADKNNKTTEMKFYGMEPLRQEFDEKGKPEKYDLDHMYALINSQELVVTQYYTFGKLLTDIEYFMHKKADVKK
jgi:hypothetical protein